MSVKQEIIKLVENDKLSKALEKLLEVKDEDIHDLSILLKSRYTSLEKRNNQGLIDDRDYTRESNVLRKSVLSIVDQLPDELSTTQSKPEVSSSSNSDKSNSDNMLTKIIEVKKFLKDYATGDVYPNVQSTRNLIYRHTDWAHEYFKQLFARTTDEYKFTYIPWEQLLVDTKLDNNPVGVKALVETLGEFISEVSKEVEDKEKKNEEETLFEVASRENSTFDSIDAFVKYQITRRVGDRKEQLKNDWNTAVKDFNQITGMFVKFRALKSLRYKWVVKSL